MNEDLIARLAEASEGSEELDRAIATAVMGEPIEYVVLEGDPSQTPIPMWRYPDMSQGTELRFSRSLDAAKTLVPEVVAGWAVGVDHGRPVASVGSLRIANGATLALALCIACLKARET
jgi:ABC-type cobalamin transport system permease subunit